MYILVVDFRLPYYIYQNIIELLHCKQDYILVVFIHMSKQGRAELSSRPLAASEEEGKKGDLRA